MVELAERLLGRGCDLLIHDRHVMTSRLAGANRAYVESRIPHLSRVMASSPRAVVDHAELVIVATQDEEALAALRAVDGKVVFDLVRPRGAEDLAGHFADGYTGVAW